MDDPSSISVLIVDMIYGTIRGSQNVREATYGWPCSQLKTIALHLTLRSRTDALA